MRLRASLLSLPLLVLLAACATSPRATPEAAGNRITVPLFSVAQPAGDWDVKIDSDRSRIEFARTRAWQFSTVQFTLMSVFAHAVDAGSDVPTEEKIAEHFLDNELRLMNEAAAAGEFELESVARSSETVAGRAVHALRYERMLGGSLGMQGMAERAVLYLWFPTEYSDSHRFFGFLMSETYKRGNLGVHVDLAQIDPVIASFRAHTPVLSDAH